MKNTPERTLAVAGYLVGLGLEVFLLNSYGMPHGLCDDCQCPETKSREHMQSCTCLICHSFYRGTSDLGVVAEMLKVKPWSLLGIRTGLASGVLVVDFDIHEGGADGLAVFGEWSAAGKLPNSWTVRTGGGGLHVYYAIAVDYPTRPAFVPGVDVKSSGGYVVAPGFAKMGKPVYCVQGDGFGRLALATAPVWLVEDLTRQAPVLGRRYSGPTTDAQRLGFFDRAVTKLKAADSGARNRALYAAACRAGEAWASGAVADANELRDCAVNTAQSIGLDGGEITRTWSSGFARGQEDHYSNPEASANPFGPVLTRSVK